MLSREEQKSGNSVIKYKKEKEKETKQIDHATLPSLFFFFLFGFVFFYWIFKTNFVFDNHTRQKGIFQN